MNSENLLEFSDSIVVENIDIMPSIKAFSELGGSMLIRNKSLNSKCTEDSDKGDNQSDSQSWVDYFQIILFSLMAVAISMYPVFRNSRKT